VLQHGLFGACSLSIDRASRGNGEAAAELEGAQSELQLPGRCSGVGGTDEIAEIDDDWVAGEEHKASDPSAPTDAGCGNVGLQVRAFYHIRLFFLVPRVLTGDRHHRQDEPVHAGVVPPASGEGRAGCAAALGGEERDGGGAGLAAAGQQIPAGSAGCILPGTAGIPRSDYARLPENTGARRGGSVGEGADEGAESVGGDSGQEEWMIEAAIH